MTDFTLNMDHWYPTGTLEEPFVPADVSDVKVAFPGSVGDLLPPQEKIPDAFKRHNGTEWNKIVGDWFFKGLPAGTDFVPNKGVEPKAALRHLKTIMGSFDPKHEYKEAAVAYLMSLWFKKVKVPK